MFLQKLLVLFSLLILGSVAWAQDDKLQVVTKRVDRDFAYREGYVVNIDGIKAEVDIETWEKSSIKVQIDLIAKHPNKQQAEKDLEQMKYLAQRDKNNIYLRNYLQSGQDGKEPESQMKVIYHVYLPANCPVYLKNAYGQAEVSNLINSLRVNSRFSKIQLENIKGMIDLNTNFGDIFAEKLDGNISIVSRRSDITLKEMRGRYNVKAEYGILNFYATDELVNFNLVADRSRVFFHNFNPATFAYNLSVQHGRVDYPNDLKFKFLEMKDSGIKKVTFRPNKEYYPNVTISISFGDLHIGK
jgi:hypothetical protein